MTTADFLKVPEDRVEQAVSRLIDIKVLNGKRIVNLPIVYPSGSIVAIEIEQNKDRYWISDMGNGLVEAEFMGAQSYFSSSAKQAAIDFSVQFDGNAIFALWVPSSRIEAAITYVANASAMAAATAIRKASEAQAVQKNDEIYERIAGIFGRSHVAKKAEISGRYASWETHNLVSLSGGKRAIFEFIKPHQASVASKFWMFSDLKSGDGQISLNAVVSDVKALDLKSQIIGDVANIVGIRSTDEQFRTFAEAA